MRVTATLFFAALLTTACAGKSKPVATLNLAADAATSGAVVPKGMEPLPGEKVTALDLTHSGRPDVWKYTVKDGDKERLVRTERDLNGDGKVDTWELYDEKGEIRMLVYDFDFDGKPDETLYFENGRLVKRDLAFGFDGIPRTFAYYEKGKLVRKERDTTNSGKVNYWEYWNGDQIDRIGIDLDGDGQVDRWETRQEKENEPGVTAPASPPAASKSEVPSSATP